MSKINVAIIEDEYPAVRLLNRLVSELRPEWNIIILPETVKESVKWLNSNPHPDLIFLDINLADGDSFRLIEEAEPKSAIIFTTAYDLYAIRAFAVNSIDYLLKPITRERLEQAILKYERWHVDNTPALSPLELLNIQEALQTITKKEKKYRTRFLISINQRLSALEVRDISYFYFEDRIVYAVTHNGNRHIVDVTLNQLEKELEPDNFYRVNRQFILSVQCIQKIEPYFNNRYIVNIKPGCDTQIIVSREKISALKSWLSY